MTKTAFTDKTGEPLYTGDVVQWRLGKYAMKSGGPSFHTVEISKKKGVVLKELQHGYVKQLRQSDSKYIVIVNKVDREII